MAASFTSIRVLCVDDHDLIRKGIAAILSTEADLALIAEANSGRCAGGIIHLHHPDLAASILNG